MSRLLLLLSIAFLIIALCPLDAQAQSPRVTEAYTAWDDYFFYAGFQVSDSNVISTNHTPTSQPQQDDDIEVFFETDSPEKATVRTDKTYQMAVSAGNGAYFSQGDGTAIPKSKLVLTYKYAAAVDGTLNNPGDKDTGYTVEIAIPWSELGLAGPPAPGATWGFNAISRDRDSMTTPSDKFVSLSTSVQSAADVQNPSKWTKIEFVNTVASMHSSSDVVYCPHVETQYPVIDGVLSSGEWDEADGFSFGANWINAPAPTAAEEPNITLSPFSSEAANQPPATPTAPAGTQSASGSTPGYDILLPGGGTLHVGRVPNPSATITPYSPAEQYTPPAKGKHGHGKNSQEAQLPPEGPNQNPLTPKGYGPLIKPVGPSIDTTQALPLTPQTDVGTMVIAPFVMSYSPKTPINALLDQPMDGQGIWFGGQQVGWDVEQIRDARRAGIDVLLPIYDPSDPDADTELNTLVEAIKEIRANGDDYPLLGLRLTGAVSYDAVKAFFSRVPADLRAEVILPDDQDNKPAYIIVADSTDGSDAIKTSFAADFANHPLLITTPAGGGAVGIATVSPGGKDGSGHITSRALAQTYQTSWQNAVGATPDWVYLHSWNDYANGTEVAASRQYGEQYADLTKVLSLTWAQREWHARYLSDTCPHEIAPNTLYTVTVRLENSGSLPWRVGEGYSLCYRWYKDGRLYDDSAPRIPLTKDIYPGESATVGVGVLAQNSYGGAIEPGDYVLVFDMIQGQDRWFTYAGDVPLKVHVKVLDSANSIPAYAIREIASSTPAFMQSDATYGVTVILRNEGSQEWKAGTQIIGESAGSGATLGKTAVAQDIPPGSIAYLNVPVKVSGSPNSAETIEWAVAPAGADQPSAKDTDHTDRVAVVSRDAGVSFALSDFPRHLKTGDKATAQLGLENVGPDTWPAGAYKIGYHWAYLDGTPYEDGADLTPIPTAVAPGHGAAVTVNFHAPENPGRYNLVWDIRLPDGRWASAESVSHDGSVLVAQVWVTGDKGSTPVDLSHDFNTAGVAFESNPSAANFDGQGDSLPGEMLPPDGSGEVNGNPIQIGQPGPAYYPSGYYASRADQGTNHLVSFLYPTKQGNDAIACQGQTIDLPDGKYTAIHLLAAATTGSGSAENTTFGVVYSDSTQSAPLSISDWSQSPASGAGTAAFDCPYRLGPNGIDSSSPSILGDYAIGLDSGRRLTKLTLPSDPRVKIFAITLEK